MFIERDIDLKLMQAIQTIDQLRRDMKDATFKTDERYSWHTEEYVRKGVEGRLDLVESAIRNVFRAIEDEIKVLALQESTRPDVITYWDEEFPKKQGKPAPKKEIEQ